MIALTHNQLVVRHHPLPIQQWQGDSATRSIRLVQLSDLHFYEFTDPAYYARVSAHVRALQPHIIVLTGDFIHFGPRYIPAMRAFIDALPDCAATVAVLGNHDYADGSRGRAVSEALAQTRVRLLVNAAHWVEIEGRQLWIAGVDDHKRGRPDLRRALAATTDRPQAAKAPILLLSHNPRQFDRLARQPEAARVALTLAGHTHAGHVFLPPLTPIYRFALKMKYRHGFYARGTQRLYVSAGLGSAAYYIHLPFWRTGFPRFRYNTNPEIAVFTLSSPE